MSRNMALLKGAFAAALLMVLPAVLFGQEGAGSTETVVKIGVSELSISGSIKTGVLVENDFRKDPDADGSGKYATKISPYSYDLDNGEGIQAQLNLGAAYQNGPLGFKLNLRKNLGVQPDGSDFPVFEVNNGYCWFDLFDKLVTVSAGIIDDSVWGTDALGGTASDTNYDAVSGVRLAIQPIEGLSFGVSWKLFDVERSIGPAAGLDENWVRKQPQGSWTYDSGFTASEFFSNTVIGALYTQDFFGVSLSARFHPDYVAGDYTHYRRGFDLLYGAKVKPISALTLTVDGYFTGLGVNDDSIKNIIIDDVQDPNDANSLISNPAHGYWKYTTPRQVVTGAGSYRINDKTTALARFQLANTSGINITRAEWDSDEDFGSWNIRLQGAYKPTPHITTALRGQFNFKYKGKSTKNLNDSLPGDLKREDFTDFYLMPALVLSITKGLSIGFYDFVWFYTAKGWDNPYKNSTGKPEGFTKNAFVIDLIMSF